MLPFLFRSIKYRFGCVAALALALGLAGCEQQSVEPTITIQPAPSTPTDYYFINSQAATKLLVESLDTNKIVRVDVLSGQQAIDYMRDANARRVVLVQTH